MLFCQTCNAEGKEANLNSRIQWAKTYSGLNGPIVLHNQYCVVTDEKAGGSLVVAKSKHPVSNP